MSLFFLTVNVNMHESLVEALLSLLLIFFLLSFPLFLLQYSEFVASNTVCFSLPVVFYFT
jgi:hypothetical protein